MPVGRAMLWAAMLIVLGSIRMAAGGLAVARPAMAAMIAASRAEDGCIAYSYAEDVAEPGLIRVTEIWRDRAALDRHFMSDHIAVWRATWTELGIGERRLELYEAGAGSPV